MSFDTQWLWLIALVGGPLVLGLLMAFGVRQTKNRRRDDPSGIAKTEQATHDLYEDEDARSEATSPDRPVDEDEARRREEVARMRSAGGRRR